MQAKRKFTLGDEWLYLKVYSGPRFLEQFLVQETQYMVRQILEKGWISQFFFIRYSDPDYHIRLRMRISNKKHLAPVIHQLNLILSEKVNDRSVYKVAYDTYSREIERYGNAIEIVEELFFLDSISIIRHLSQVGLSDENRWLYSMIWVDSLVDNFQLSGEEKKEYFQKMHGSYSNEFGIQKPAKIVMDKKYRKLGRKIEAVFYTSEHSDQYKLIVNEVEAFSKSSGRLVKDILESNKAKKLNVQLESLVSSTIHMHINRMFRTEQRKYELLIYHFLLKFHTSRMARAKFRGREKRKV